MENRVEILETSDVDNAEIDRFLEGLDTEFPSVPTDVVDSTNEAQQDESVEEDSQSEDFLIQPNSQSILVDEYSSRFSSAIWYDSIKDKNVLIAGVGGIGSYVALLLSRVKPNSITIYDPDIVEEGNMSGQLYSIRDIGLYKAYSIARAMVDYSDFYRVYCNNIRYTEDSSRSNIMICGFDNMQARKVFFNNWKQHVDSLTEEEKGKCLFIDGRLAAEEFQVFCITGDDLYHQNLYQTTYLFSDSEADETICSYKQTSHCASMIGSIIVNLFVNFVANECDPLIPRDLPFITTYDAERMFFKTSIQ